MRWIRTFFADTRGGTLIEYGLIVALIVIAIMASLQSVAGKSISMWNNVSTKFSAAG